MGKEDKRRKTGDAGRCTKQKSQRLYARKRRSLNKGKKIKKNCDSRGLDRGGETNFESAS